jgi:HD-GYP domain-containing protein (c-di-GMP phosphodiesterase class II)
MGHIPPSEAVIVTIVDSFDAKNLDRPYSPALSLDDGITEIKLCSGTQLDLKY